jgi:hypothetical protein
MSKNDERRVLNRLGARELSDRECQQVPGAFIQTHNCTFNFVTCTVDGDGCEQIPSCP